jgi:hypothetical protein
MLVMDVDKESIKGLADNCFAAAPAKKKAPGNKKAVVQNKKTE